MKKNQNQRNSQNPDLNYRTLSLRLATDGRPETLNDETRSVEVIGASEERVRVFDWQRCEVVDEVLLMSGCQIPKSRQVVMLDTHRRYDTSAVIGSYRQIQVAGNKLLGRAHYSTVPEAEGPYIKMREGHLTDYSVGYSILKSTWIPAGENKKIKGREYPGPVSIVTRWKISELSNCPIGADGEAKARTPADIKNIPQNENNKPTLNQEVHKMNPKLRQILVETGLKPVSTETEAWRFFNELEESARAEIINSITADTAAGTDESADDSARAADLQPTPAAAPDFVAEIAAERARSAEIRALGQRYECLDQLQTLIDDGSTVDQARAKALEIVSAARAAEPAPGAGFSPARVVADERDKFRNAAQDALLLRSDVMIETPAAGADELTGYSMTELARMALAKANQPTRGHSMEMVGRALTTSDFPTLLANVANKSLFAGFATAEETWPQVFATGSVSDFKTQTSARASETEDLEEVAESGEFKHGSQTEAKEEYSIATYGKLYSISRQAIINDDLGALTSTPRNHGEAAARKIGDVGYAVLTANAAMGDGVALFHASHSNLGTGGALASVKLAEMIKLMKLQKDLKGNRRLNIRPRFFLAPVTLEGSAEQFFNSVIDPGKSITGINNPYAGTYFTRVYEPRLDDDSATAYYVLGAKGKTVTIFFLNGQQKPYMETRKGWDVDGVEYKVRIDAGAKAMDWKAMVKNAGA